MKIFSWNMNGIRAVEKRGDLRPFLATYDPDILCIQETKANHEQIEFDFPQYEEYWYSADKKGYSGTAIFTKFEPLEVINGLPSDIAEKYKLDDAYGNTLNEGRIITAEFEPFYISTVYTPNAKDDLSRIPMRQQWDPAYLEYMVRLESEKPVIYCGDFNVAHTEIDLARPKENMGKKGFTVEERAGFDAMVNAGFVDTFRLFNKEGGNYTWWSHFGNARERNVGWRIDYIMSSRQLVPLIKNARIHPEVYGSDHCPVALDLAIEL
ncbi:MAG TPA: exodeoxyribonuclease III [Candidatus Paceibacterota bacterium]